MLYMVIERFREGCGKEIYERAKTYGRMMPEGLGYLDSWVTPDLGTCSTKRGEVTVAGNRSVEVPPERSTQC